MKTKLSETVERARFCPWVGLASRLKEQNADDFG
jgi:hypothetical protein